MVQLIDIVTFVIGSLVFFNITTRLKYGKITIYSLLVVLFYIFQFLPLATGFLYDEGDYAFSNINIYKAMHDAQTAIVYDVIIIVILIYLYYRSKKTDKYFHTYYIRLRQLRFGNFFLYISIFFMILPLLLALLSPNPTIYTIFAYSYRNDLTIEEELYHNIFMIPSIQISILSFALYYAQKDRSKWFAYLMMFVITWLTFKRTGLFFMSLIILGLDYVSGKYEFSKLFKKSALLALICVSYFVAYSNITGKGQDSDSYNLYTMYYGRNYCVKTAIYDQLNGNKMLDYRGQTILFDFFFYVPRSIWKNKPAMYSKYSTAYSQGRKGYDATTNFYVNIWAEYISNFHFLGVLLAFLFIHLFLRISQRSDNLFVYLMGVVFISFYFFWGVQPFTMWIIGLWAIGLLYSKIRPARVKVLRL